MAARSREVNNHWKPFYINCNTCKQRCSSCKQFLSLTPFRQILSMNIEGKKNIQVRSDPENGNLHSRFLLHQQTARAQVQGG